MSKKRVFDSDTLFLTIKKKYLDKIIAGTKKIEYRDVTDYYINKFCIIDKETDEPTGYKPYKFVVFQAGYSKTSPRAKFELKEIMLTEYDEYEDIKDDSMIVKAGDMYFELSIGKQIKI